MKAKKEFEEESKTAEQKFIHRINTEHYNDVKEIKNKKVHERYKEETKEIELVN